MIITNLIFKESTKNDPNKGTKKSQDKYSVTRWLPKNDLETLRNFPKRHKM